jgi:hypothetical protein
MIESVGSPKQFINCLFAWEVDQPTVENLFASSPSQFRNSFEIINDKRVVREEQNFASPPSIWGGTVKLEMQLGSANEEGYIPAYLNCCVLNGLVCLMVARNIGHDQRTWTRRGGYTLSPRPSLSAFAPKQLSFKMVPDMGQRSLYEWPLLKVGGLRTAALYGSLAAKPTQHAADQKIYRRRRDFRLPARYGGL